MSFVGNFNLASADRTTKTSGALGAEEDNSLSVAHHDEEEDIEKELEERDSHGSSHEKNRGTSGESDEEVENLRRDKEVFALARKYTTQSSYAAYDKNPFEAEPGSSLDPQSSDFQPRQWAKSLLNLTSRDPEKWSQRTAGFAFKNLNVHGFGSTTDYQKTVGNIFLQAYGEARRLLKIGQTRIDILQNLDGIVYNGEMLVVLGPPGSGCSTFLKTIAGETHGFYVDEGSYLNYQGITSKQMNNDFRGEVTYMAETDVHFPMLTVGQTLEFAAAARAPRHIPGGVSAIQYAQKLRDVIMAVFGISHTLHTRVGNDFVRGVSGGERKRVSIAEVALSAAPLQCWDNSTRGLDSANAIEFCKTLRMSTDIVGSTAAVSIYQSPQSAYDTFDKVLLLYRGRQIYFGKCGEASEYFTEMGFYRKPRQTTADFLTSMTSTQERIARKGFENQVPRTPDEFAERWRKSTTYARLQAELEAYEQKYTFNGERLEIFKESRRAQAAKIQRIKSPYTLSYYGQTMLCLRRGFWRLKADPSLTYTQLFGNGIMAIIIGSVFYNLQLDTNSFFQRSALLFFAILLNAFGSALEVLTLYAQRPIVEKHARYAFYHPSTEAFASMLTDMPFKIVNTILFNLALYFLTNLRRTPGAFFFFLLISFILTMVMSMLFRCIASFSRTLAQALAPTAVLIMAIIIYTGFALPIPYMHGWARWINYLDPVAYGFESLMINEFAGRRYACSVYVPTGPDYANVTSQEHICSAQGAVLGLDYVDGTTYIETTYQYNTAHKWRNFGILIAFMVGLCALYLLATEYISAKKSKGEVLVFPRGHIPSQLKKNDGNDIEALGSEGMTVSNAHGEGAFIEKQKSVFHWEDICYDIKIKGNARRILDHVDGWVQPGTLTALMGVSGAGKTTLLDVLATRTTMGVISGEIFVDGRQRDASFQRKTGYVQQQDLHLSTSTVREALRFSALLRQPNHYSHKEKLAYVDEVIKLLDMQDFADAVVGVPGEGLNVEQRKRLTIGVELAARPQLLLFLDEPTSGLDSQTSWAICDLMEKLTKNGQAILCTIHQPSAMLFQRFDRLLFLQNPGKTVYFGPVGQNSKELISYFESNGAPKCPPEANPAEWMLEVIGAAPGSKTDIDWHQVWRDSPEFRAVKDKLNDLRHAQPIVTQPKTDKEDKSSYLEFAAPFWVQMLEVTKRVFEQYWRTPSYIYAKATLAVFATLFIGFSFYDAGTSQQSLQNQLFSIFMLLTLFSQITQQIMPNFVIQRSLYEVRERPSKTYSWKAFMLANIVTELFWNSIAGMIMFFCWYYPIGLYKNAEKTHEVHSRGATMFLIVLAFLWIASTFAHMLIAAMDSAETAGNIGNLLFSLSLIFCGVLATPQSLPGFWIFMYRVSPFTYLVSAILSVAVANTDVVCAQNELRNFFPPGNLSCFQYLQPYTDVYGGYLINPNATNTQCEFCAISSTNQFLATLNIYFDNRWRNYGILWAYIAFNIFAATFLYWLVRVPKQNKNKNRPAKEGAETAAGALSKTTSKAEPKTETNI